MPSAFLFIPIQSPKGTPSIIDTPMAIIILPRLAKRCNDSIFGNKSINRFTVSWGLGITLDFMVKCITYQIISTIMIPYKVLFLIIFSTVFICCPFSKPSSYFKAYVVIIDFGADFHISKIWIVNYLFNLCFFHYHYLLP